MIWRRKMMEGKVWVDDDCRETLSERIAELKGVITELRAQNAFLRAQSITVYARSLENAVDRIVAAMPKPSEIVSVNSDPASVLSVAKGSEGSSS